VAVQLLDQVEAFGAGVASSTHARRGYVTSGETILSPRNRDYPVYHTSHPLPSLRLPLGGSSTWR
jgi:hypothetical protein